MGKGVQRILFYDRPEESKQIIRLPDLNGCPVYGLMANGLKIKVYPDISTEDYHNNNQKGKHSGIKWVTGIVKHLGKGGIKWFRLYKDSNGNEIKDATDTWTNDNDDVTLMQISKTDPHKIGSHYERTDYLEIWFAKQENFKPEMYWVEPFSIYPELHTSKKPKGAFFVAIDTARPYEALVLALNSNRQFIEHPLWAEKTAYDPQFYYGDQIELDIKTTNLPTGSELEIKIFNSEQETPVNDPTILVKTEETWNPVFSDTALNIYAKNIYHKAIISLPLDIKYKPESQKSKTSDFLRFEISYKPPQQPVEPFKWDDMTARIDNARDKITETYKKIFEDDIKYKKNQQIENAKSANYKLQEKANEFKIIPLVGYVYVYYNDTTSYIEKRERDIANKMVEVANEQKEAPGNNPCHYTKIIAERVKDVSIDYTPDESIIFDEENIIASKSPEIHMIAGEKGKAELKLKVDLDEENECKNNIHTEGSTSVFKLSEDNARDQNISKYKITKDTISLSPRYIYIKDGSTMFPLNYFCLKNVKPLTYYVPIETCRYKKTAKILVYPDLEWSAIVKYNAENSSFVYKTPNFGYRTNRDVNYNRRLNGNYQSERGKTFDKSYEFAVEAGFKCDSEEYVYDSEKGIPLVNAVCFIMDAYKIIREYLYADETENAESSIASNREEVRVRDDRDTQSRSMSQRYQERKGKGLPIKITVDRPSFSGGIHAQFTAASTPGMENKVGYAYSLDFAAEPLFKVTGKLDLLFYAQFIPYIGQALKAINKVVEGINFLTLGAVHIDYYLNIAASVAVNLDWKGIEYHSIDGFTVSKKIGAKIPIRLWVEAGVNLNINLQGIGKVDAEGAMKGEAKIDIEISHDRVANSCDASIDFKGLEVKIWLKFKAEIKEKDGGDESSPEPDTEPDHIKKLLDGMKQPWKINIL